VQAKGQTDPRFAASSSTRRHPLDFEGDLRPGFRTLALELVRKADEGDEAAALITASCRRI